MKFEWITDWDTIWSDAFQTQWLEWMEISNHTHVFSHPTMAKVWIDTYLPIRDIKPLFCIARDDKKNLIFLPLVVWQKDWKSAFEKVIVPVGYSDYDYNTPIMIGDTIDYNLFWTQLIENIFLQLKSNFDSIEMSGIEEQFIATNQDWIFDDICPVINLQKFKSYEQLLTMLKSKERGDINRQVRRLQEHDNYEFKVYKETELDEALKILPTILEHHKKRWPNAYKAPQYHYNLLSKLLPLGLIHFSEIKINNKGISWNISFKYNDTYYFYMPTHDEEYKKYSPGKINMFLSIKNLMSNGFAYFDMLRGAENYKNRLPIDETKVFKLKISNNNLSTKLKKVALNVKSQIKS
jgi:CelD/BcsL family acetyltransferase involved in cellulose biosynthesis